MPPKLDPRLDAVACHAVGPIHVDIGSDHGYLLANLLRSGQIERGIAIENKQAPLRNSIRTLADLNCDIRMGDGLAVLEPGEADSLSICGMGATSVVQILGAFPRRIPNRLVVQPNRRAELVRRWAMDHRFHLIAETIVREPRSYEVIAFDRSHTGGGDPAYQAVDRELGLIFGPLNLQRSDDRFQQQLREEFEYLRGFGRLSAESRQRLDQIRSVLDSMS